MSQLCPQNLIQQDVLNVCNFLKTLMSLNERGKVYKILKDFKSKSPDNDISYFLDELLPWADVLFCRFIKGENKDIINSFHTFDKILHGLPIEDIISLLKFDIIEPVYSAQINETTLEHVIYMIMQFSEYRDEIISYMFEKYSDIITINGFVKHLLFNNINNDIIVYLKALHEKNLIVPEYITFERVIDSYKFMYEKNTNANYLNSRLLHVIDLFVNTSIKYQVMMPSFQEYYESLKKLYTVQGNNEHIIKAMHKLCFDCHSYINGKLPWGLQYWNIN
jgi:hypothetical protein